MSDQDATTANGAAIPIERMAELTFAVMGPAARLVAEARAEQIFKHGHDREADAMQPINGIPRRAKERLQAAIEQIEGTGAIRNLPVARRNLARVAAMCMAGIDRLDLAMKLEEQE